MKLVSAGAGATIVALDQSFNTTSEKELFGIVDGLPASVRNILLDFNDVDSMDNTGLNVLVKLGVRASRPRRHLFAINVNHRYLEIFSVTGLDAVYHVYASMSDVLRAVGSDAGEAVKSVMDRPAKAPSCAAPVFPCWSPGVHKLAVPKVPPEAVNLNVQGRRTAGPAQGFGQLWQKTYAIDLTDTNLAPEQIISILKDNFPRFQPPENRFYPSEAGIKPGEVILINASTPGGLVATGVMVLYAYDSSFTFITPAGHPEAGWVTFSCFREGGRTYMQVQGLARASDPIYEAAFRLAGSGIQERIWTYLLQSLAKYTGSRSNVTLDKQCLDRSLQWSNVFNVFRNAQISSMLFSLTHPLRKHTHAV